MPAPSEDAALGQVPLQRRQLRHPGAGLKQRHALGVGGGWYGGWEVRGVEGFGGSLTPRPRVRDRVCDRVCDQEWGSSRSCVIVGGSGSTELDRLGAARQQDVCFCSSAPSPLLPCLCPVPLPLPLPSPPAAHLQKAHDQRPPCDQAAHGARHLQPGRDGSQVLRYRVHHARLAVCVWGGGAKMVGKGGKVHGAAVEMPRAHLFFKEAPLAFKEASLARGSLTRSHHHFGLLAATLQARRRAQD